MNIFLNIEENYFKKKYIIMIHVDEEDPVGGVILFIFVLVFNFKIYCTNQTYKIQKFNYNVNYYKVNVCMCVVYVVCVNEKNYYCRTT